jgi:hypothetical protein
MAVEGTLTGWIELVSSTQLTRLNEIVVIMRKLAEDDKSLEIVGLEAANTELARADFTCWDNPAPNFAALFRPLVDLLEEEEYIYFEEKVKFGQRGRTLRAILVTGVGIFKAEQDALILLLQERNSEISSESDVDTDSDDLDDDLDDADLDGDDEPVSDDPMEEYDREHDPEPDVPDCDR